jgi:2-methylcitrate dehydratase PrpD
LNFLASGGSIFAKKKGEVRMRVADRLVEFAQGAAPGEGALAMMRLSLFDWAACGIAGRGEPVARITRQMVLEEGGRGEAALIGGGRAPARGAALVNGATSHALDYDDTHFAHIGHPSVAVIPAALALAEREGAGGADFLRAALIGVEGSIRLGVWLGRAHYQTGFHQTATAGAFGAALAAGVLLGCGRGQLGHALGLAATRASGLKSQFGTMGKPYNAGLAAANGVEVALLARAGMVSDPGAVDGLQGFGPTHAGEALEAAFDGLGEDWLFETVSHKFHACCHGTHAMLEALAGARDLDPQAVRAVTVTTHPRWLRVCDQPAPTTGLEAKFSYRMTAAMALCGHDTGDLGSFTDALCAEPALVALRDKVRVEADEALSETAARVVIEMADGSRNALSHDLEAPITLAERGAKLRAKARALLGEADEARLWAATDAAAPDPAVLAGLLQ